MRRTWSFWLILFLAGIVLPLAAQEEEPEDPEEEIPPAIEWEPYVPDMYRRGDMTFAITAGVIFPTIFTGKGMEEDSSNLKLGGAGSLTLNYFLSSHWFVGGEFGGMFSATGGNNMIYIIPFGLRIGYQLVLNRFEIPFSMMIGAAPQKYLEKEYLGLIIKPAASLFFRFNPDWSFGLNAQWWMLPQWPANDKDVLGNFLELSLSAKYHF